MEKHSFAHIIDDYDFVKVLIAKRDEPTNISKGIVVRVDDMFFVLSNLCNLDGGWGITARRINDKCGTAYSYGWTFSMPEENESVIDLCNYIITIATDMNETELDSEDESSNNRISATNMINKNYKQDRLYSGIHDYHSHDYEKLNQPVHHKGGYKVCVEIEVEFSSRNKWYDFSQVKSNWFYCEQDSSLSSLGCEIISVPLRPQDAKNEDTWVPLHNMLRGNALSWDSRRCGLHIHLGKEILGSGKAYDNNLGKLLFLYNHHIKDTSVNVAVFGRSQGYCANTDPRCDESKAALALGTDALKIKCVKDAVGKGLIRKNGESRWFDINITNSNTIEFRKGRGTYNPARIASVIEWCECLCKFAKITKWENLTYPNFIAYVMSRAKSQFLLDIINRNY